MTAGWRQDMSMSRSYLMMMTLFSASTSDCRVLMELVLEKLCESVHSVHQSDVRLRKCMAGDRGTGEVQRMSRCIAAHLCDEI